MPHDISPNQKRKKAKAIKSNAGKLAALKKIKKINKEIKKEDQKLDKTFRVLDKKRDSKRKLEEGLGLRFE
jgi:phage terminase small subunit